MNDDQIYEFTERFESQAVNSQMSLKLYKESLGYSTLYTVVFLDWNPDAQITRVELYQWISVAILVLGMAYFLW